MHPVKDMWAGKDTCDAPPELCSHCWSCPAHSALQACKRRVCGFHADAAALNMSRSGKLHGKHLFRLEARPLCGLKAVSP